MLMRLVPHGIGADIGEGDGEGRQAARDEPLPGEEFRPRVLIRREVFHLVEFLRPF